MYKGLYIARHDRLVDLISSNVKEVFLENATMYKHSRIMPEWFNSSIDVFCDIQNTPDVVFLNRDRREVLLLEIGCVFDLYMETAFNDKIVKYQPILEILRDLGYQCKLIDFIFGSLGHVLNRVFSGLRLAGLSS